ncbi:MAG: TrmH family RNA methyltransferase [Bacteroidetes bacterium]|nr:TrmH family RNA methyltransferase [Bacteroidota bacterium]MBS1629706.1 TrmH family RNA methyltransferase [Bacteroidota bacterium]
MEALGRRMPEEVIQAPAHPWLLILDDVRSMHNVGAAFRTADAFGISGMYLCGFTPTPPHRDIRKTALGAEESVAWLHFTHVEDALTKANQEGYRIVAIEQAQPSTLLSEWSGFRDEKLALIFGNEVSGVSDAALAAAAQCIEIPQWGAKHSLNISVSIGVVLWELARNMKGR